MVADSVVTGYQSGGILFDGGRGKDGSADNIVRTGLRQHGYVTNTVVKGNPNTVFAQTGIKYTNGFNGFVKTSRITGNYFKTDPTKSYGILLTDAGTDTAGALVGSSDVITGNGFAVYNANADNSAVRSGAPFVLTGSYVGLAAPISTGGLGDPSVGTEAISPPDSTPAATVTVPGRVSTATAVAGPVPTGVGAITDAAPTAAVVDPAAGTTLQVGEEIAPIVSGRDDFAVKSAALVVDGKVVATSTEAPYEFNWTPTADFAGKSVGLSGVVIDSAGNVTISPIVTVSVAAPAVVTPPPSSTPPTSTPPTSSTSPTPGPVTPNQPSRLERCQ